MKRNIVPLDEQSAQDLDRWKDAVSQRIPSYSASRSEAIRGLISSAIQGTPPFLSRISCEAIKELINKQNHGIDPSVSEGKKEGQLPATDIFDVMQKEFIRKLDEVIAAGVKVIDPEAFVKIYQKKEAP